ncbi:unnamed protein product [marine sediment metagenome]|uniref:PABS domain-containing protein n=1 Tax=marine sediment metagenome TaxID=412755 RepID=X0WB36_9ZZZZ
MASWEDYKVDIPEGKEGDWTVSKFDVSKEEASTQNMRASFAFSSRGMGIEAGTYTRLQHGGTTVMSDTPSEIRDHRTPIDVARGEVLIVGLGIGMVAAACLKKPGVTKVTVVEMSPEVIHLTGDHLKGIYGDRLEIIEADILDWKPPKGRKWDVAWFDIWNDKCGDNTVEMSKLNRRYGRRTEWKGCWGESECKEANRQWAREKKALGLC